MIQTFPTTTVTADRSHPDSTGASMLEGDVNRFDDRSVTEDSR